MRVGCTRQLNLLVVLVWVGLGPIFFHLLWVGLGCVNQLMGWVGSGHTKWTHGQLCDKPVETVFSQTLTMLSPHLVKFVTAKATLVLLLFHVR